MRSALAILATVLGLGFIPTLAEAETKIAIFAGGCFWCMEKDFEHVKGVIEVESGYAGGTTENPTYKTYEAGRHIEVVKITYEDTIVDYNSLLHTFWRSVNPTDPSGQFCDRGHGYSTAIFALDEEQKALAVASKEQTDSSGALEKKIVTPIHDAATFYPAEDFHQDYYKKNPLKYTFYRGSCGRDRAIRALWGKQAHAGIQKKK